MQSHISTKLLCYKQCFSHLNFLYRASRLVGYTHVQCLRHLHSIKLEYIFLVDQLINICIVTSFIFGQKRMLCHLQTSILRLLSTLLIDRYLPICLSAFAQMHNLWHKMSSHALRCINIGPKCISLIHMNDAFMFFFAFSAS